MDSIGCDRSVDYIPLMVLCEATITQQMFD